MSLRGIFKVKWVDETPQKHTLYFRFSLIDASPVMPYSTLYQWQVGLSISKYEELGRNPLDRLFEINV